MLRIRAFKKLIMDIENKLIDDEDTMIILEAMIV